MNAPISNTYIYHCPDLKSNRIAKGIPSPTITMAEDQKSQKWSIKPRKGRTVKETTNRKFIAIWLEKFAEREKIQGTH